VVALALKLSKVSSPICYHHRLPPNLANFTIESFTFFIRYPEDDRIIPDPEDKFPSDNTCSRFWFAVVTPVKLEPSPVKEPVKEPVSLVLATVPVFW
jgi:hypothetical protein